MSKRITIVRHCYVCNKDVTYLSRHIAKYHPEISELDYYNTYLKKSEKDGFCKYCGKPTKFHGIIKRI